MRSTQSQIIYDGFGDPVASVASSVIFYGIPYASMCLRVVSALRDVDCEGLCSKVGF